MEKKNCESCGKPISGIVCDVTNCKYHQGTDKCCAQHICVGPSNASSSGETACVTFQPKY